MTNRSILDYNTNNKSSQIVRLFRKRTLLHRWASRLIVLLFVALLLHPQMVHTRSLSSSTTWVVSPHGGDFTSIGRAINRAAEGDTIHVMPGVYRERFTIYKNVTIVGIGQRQNIRIESANPILFNAATATIKNLTIRNKAGSEKGRKDFYAVKIAGGQLNIKNCDVSGGVGTAITVSAYANPRLTKNRIYAGLIGIDIEAYGSGVYSQNTIYANALWGVVAGKASNPSLRDNIISANLAGGVALLNDSQALLEGNKISLNTINGVMVQKSTPTLRRNHINANLGMGIFIIDSSRGTYSGNIIKSNTAAGIVVQASSQPYVEGNTITRNRYGVSIGRRAGGTYTNNDIRDNNRGAFEVQDDAGQITAYGNLPHNP